MTAHVTALFELEDWCTEEFAARVHYRGTDDAYGIGCYEPSDCALYWKVKGDGEVAVPVGRDTTPDPLCECVRRDLVEVGIDPEVEDRVV